MEIRNLTQDNVNELESLVDKLKEGNPELSCKTFQQEDVLTCMVGLPYSGKSTWAQQQELPIVSADAIRIALHGNRFLPEAEPMVHVVVKIMVKALFLAGNSHVILDETNTTKKRRDEWMSSAWTTEFKHIDTSESECIGRATDAEDDVIIPIIRKMAVQFEPLVV